MTPDIRVLAAADTRPLRERLLRPGAPPEQLVYPADDAATTTHLGAYAPSARGDDSADLIGIASLYAEPWSAHPGDLAFRLRGMATVPEVRGTGVGAALVAEVSARARPEGGRWLWCNARISAKGFYQRLGFEPHGEEFEIDGIGAHIVMGLEIR